MRTPRRLLGATVLLSTALGGALAAAPTSAGADDGAGSDGTRIEAASSGRVALAADRYGLTKEAVRDQLAADDSLRLASNGALYYVDPAPATQPSGQPSAEGLRAQAPLADTFKLHSKPGSQRTVYLDFNGHTVADTGWNHPYIAMDNGFHPAWNPLWYLGDGDAFHNDELVMIQDIWARVAEDYAPFDVDVTTEEPPAASIDRSSATDQVYGTRALITPSDEALNAICGGGCGGVAYLEAFDLYLGKDPAYPQDDHALLQPAWVFPQALGDDPKSIAEAITHEVGHNLGLEHDGTTTEGYYTGHNGWAPIMGVGYQQPIVQWALNDYPNAKLGGPGDGAGSWQDFVSDVQTIAAHGAPERSDDAANGTAGAGPVPTTPTTGVISNRDDRDVFALGSCTGPLTVAADGAPVSPNLDIRLELLDAGGSVVDTDDPVSAADPFDWDIASGLDAEVSIGSASGNYYVRVDGVGRGTATNGYTDYGSLGAYVLDVTGNCTASEPPDETTPSAPRNLAGSQIADGTVRLTWQAPLDDGGAAITAYHVYQDGTLVRQLAAGATSVELTGVAAGGHSFAVAAVNSVGEGTRANVSVTVTGDDPGDVPGAPVLGEPKAGKRGKPYTAVFPWTAPAADPAIDHFQVIAYKKTASGWKKVASGDVPADWNGVQITNKKTALTIRIRVRACNSVGCGAWSQSSAVRLR